MPVHHPQLAYQDWSVVHVRRATMVCLPVLMVAALLGGCAPQGPATGSGGTGAAEPTSAAQPAAAKGLTAMTPTTDGEKAALALAKTGEGRKWAAGNPNGSVGAASGDPMLVGYQVQLNDGKKTGYSVMVLDGKVYSFFGVTPPPAVKDALVVFDYDKTNMYTFVKKPASPDQETALQTAIAYVLENKQVQTTGGIEAYSIAFPVNGSGQYPMVQVFANTSTGKFSSGGPVVR
jgi:hypothetical protein